MVKKTKPPFGTVQFGPLGLANFKLKLGLADAVAVMELNTKAASLYVNIGEVVGGGRFHPPLDRFASELGAAVQAVATVTELEVVHTNLWLGLTRPGEADASTRSGFHADPYHNLIVVLNGTKSVRLLDPPTGAARGTVPVAVHVAGDGLISSRQRVNPSDDSVAATPPSFFSVSHTRDAAVVGSTPHPETLDVKLTAGEALLIPKVSFQPCTYIVQYPYII